ncbi:M20 family metallopeptidase [Nocardioides sp. NPDC006273]|uniref:M20 metallopeptidase family protein n=1 Tax=Nocardioides sp. NPDC006273 TaxID=3155598 RepID=UPI0033BC8B5A
MRELPSPTDRLLTASHALLPDLVALRREIHRDPEVGLDLPRTQQRVLSALAGLDLEVTTGTGLSSVVAVLRGGRPGPTVLLRADMDALPIAEQSGLPYASTSSAMHACGHDLHIAGLVGAARLLDGIRDELAGNVVLMFQPGEEGHAGAAKMIDEGLLEITGELPVAAYAVHVRPGPRGTFVSRPGAVTASMSRLAVTVHGRGGHGSRPHEACDPVPVLAEVVLALQSFVTRRFDVFDPVVVSVGSLAAGVGAANVICDSASLTGTVRTMSPHTLSVLKEALPRLVEGIAAAHDTTATVELSTGYPSVVNDPALTGAVLSRLRHAFGENRVLEAPTPTMGAEDFSFITQRVPGAMFLLLATPPGHPGVPAPNHSPHAVFDDSVLADQAAALALLAAQTLASHATAPTDGSPS